MDPSPKDLTDQIDEATTLLLRTAESLTDAQIEEPSLLHGWTRGYLLGHITRNANALLGFLGAVPVSGETGVAALRASAAALQTAFEAMPADGWDAPVDLPDKQVPARHLLIMRLVEIELHHVDLDAGYVPADWPTTFNELELRDPQRQWRADRLV